MSILSGKNILLGVTAGIAAYKTAFLTRLLVKAGAEVKVVMTPAATEFITPLTLSVLAKNPVYVNFTNEHESEERWHSHVDLGLWADYMLIAPATANTLAKMRNGMADNLLVATYLSAKCPVFVAPTMDLDMYLHPSTQNNIDVLKSYDNIIIPPEVGELASGLEGPGRMAEPEAIIAYMEKHISQDLPLNDKKVLITAGPTYEAIDPVRYIGNHSSGKMGFELARQAVNMGAQVTLITGPTNQDCSFTSINRIDVVSAEEMYKAVFAHYDNADIVIAAAAVADYKPVEKATQKIKKKSLEMQLKLTKTRDILKEMGKEKRNQFLMGFALETQDEIKNAQKKIAAKNLDAIVLNSLNDEGAGFQYDTNKIKIIDSDDQITAFSLRSKKEVAKDIFDFILNKIP